MPVIARVFGAPGRSITTRPGHQVQLRGGLGHVYHGEDMPALLRHAELSIEVSPEVIDWLPGWAAQCGEHAPAAAQVTVPGMEIGPAPTYVIPEPADSVPPVVRKRREKEGTHGGQAASPSDSLEAELDALLPKDGWGHDGQEENSNS